MGYGPSSSEYWGNSNNNLQYEIGGSKLSGTEIGQRDLVVHDCRYGLSSA
jgi:hypothetical protein